MTHKRTILVVDDDTALLKLLGIRLKASGWRVAVAESAEQALAVLDEVQPNVVITDLRMGGMDGMALFDAVHQRYPAMPVIVLTAHGTIPEAVEATKRGVFTFLTKPFESRALLDAVEHAYRLNAASGGGLEEADTDDWRAEVISRSTAMQEVLHQARRVADSNVAVLIQGESGTGKELLARAVHRASARREGAFLAINCSAIPENLLESELFGHAKGAFTGATHDHKGLFQAASGGTVFLDEIGDMPLVLQAKLLRVLQEKEVRAVGSTRSVPVDVRIVSATHRDLEAMVAEGSFREDLFYRLNVVRLDIPPLRERREDIQLLVNHFLREMGEEAAEARPMSFSDDAMACLLSAPWPGNVRQLQNVVEHTAALSTTAVIPGSLVRRALRQDVGAIPSFTIARQHFERDYLTRLMKMTEGNISQAARLAQRNRTELYKLLHRYHLKPETFRSRPASKGRA
ncbi:sigma 54-interacting transcriptional regulator [Ectothiorhodospiraceae bacterium 2226]|nr:sigma 54-interacting transcriptional regulator [Ectothiorhodospiraceae bacterium 2226]